MQMKLQSLTKIIATLSDTRCDVDFIRSLQDAGMTAVRLNTAHQDFEGSLRVIRAVREVSSCIPVILDTKGPEIRTIAVESEFAVQKGDEIQICGSKPEGSVAGASQAEPEHQQGPDASCTECLYVNYEGIARDLSVGNRILIDDGDVEFSVTGKRENSLLCRVENDGVIKNRKSVNIPNAHIHLPALSDRDRDYIHFATEHNVDFIAHSFVRSVADVEEILQIIESAGSACKVIAKIENQEGVDNIDSIIDRVYGIMVARGDLGIEIAAERIPAIQKQIIAKCRAKCRPVITATQMLHSMISSPRPTRAEVSDVANAIYDGTDCLMLSGETAYGDYPVEAVQTMARIARYSEKATRSMVNIEMPSSKKQIPAFLARTAVLAESKIRLSAIVIDTATGRTARYIAAFRGNAIIYVESYSWEVVRQLGIVYGVSARYHEVKHTGAHSFLNKSLNNLIQGNFLSLEDTVLILAGHFGPYTGASFIEISTVENMLRGKSENRLEVPAENKQQETPSKVSETSE